MRTQKIERLKEAFKAPSRQKINEIVEDIPEVYRPEKYIELIQEVKSEEELEKAILKKIKDGYIKKEDWKLNTPKNKQELYEKEKDLFYMNEAMVEFSHANTIWEKIKDELNGEEKEEISLYIKLSNSFKLTEEELKCWHEKVNNKPIIIEPIIENQIKYKISQDYHAMFLNFIRKDKAEKFALSQIQDYKTFKNHNTFYLKDAFLNEKTDGAKNKKYLIVLEVSDEFSKVQQGEIQERLNLMLKHKKIKDPKIIAEIKKVLG